MRTTRLLAALATPALVCALVAGCGGGNPKPQSLPSKSASPTPSPSPSPTPPVLPAVAKTKTKAGAIAFARHFIETLNYSGSSGDTEPLRQLFIPLCTRCEAIADGIDETYRAGGEIAGGSWHARSFKFYAIKNEVAFVDAAVDYDAQTLTKSAGASPSAFPASKGNLKAFNLRWRGNGWATSALDPNQ